MKNVKRRIETFTFYDHTSIVAHLEAMALKGWLLEKNSSLFWVYYRAEPQVVHYAVSYNPKASVFRPVRTEAQESFDALCEHTGWYNIISNSPMQIYRNYHENPVPIDTDPMIELKNIQCCRRKRILPTYFLFILYFVYLWIHIVRSQNWNPISLLSNGPIVFGILIMITVLLFYVIDIGNYHIWYHKARIAARNGVFLETRFASIPGRFFIVILLFLVCCLYISAAFDAGSISLPFVLIFPIGYIGIFILVGATRDELQENRAAVGATFIAIIAASFILVFALQALIRFVTNIALDHTQRNTTISSYKHEGELYIDYNDTLPLSLADLASGDFQQYNTRLVKSGSILLATVDGHHWPHVGETNTATASDIDYIVVIVRAPFLYTLCKDYMLEKQDEAYSVPYEAPTTTPREYDKIDASSWGAKEAYQWTPSSSDYVIGYLLCYDSRIIEIAFNWVPMQSQMITVGEKLGGVALPSHEK
jgi:hypothetical protein